MTEAKLYREHIYRSADGSLDVFARDYPADEAGADRVPLLMMHGLTRNSADFEPLIALLGAGTRRMIVPDQRGRGLSQYDPDPANYRPDVYAADMWALLDGLGIDEVVCIGTSMGGLISMVMGAQAPERVHGIVLNDVGPEVSEEGLERIRGYVGPAEPIADWGDAAARCAAINGSALLGFTPDDWMAFAKRTCRELPDCTVEFAYDPAISQGMAEDDTATVPPDLWALWDALQTIPILSIRGALSDILTTETVMQMAKRRAGDMAYVEVPDRGHAPILDEPIAAAAISGFLAR
ncbi:alpha/beta fold hydrolase [Erythrobacter sp. HA6-11]